MATMDIQVPDIGDFDEVAVIELLVKPGDTVKAEQSLITVESDKASMEIPSSHAGVVKELKVKLGDKVKQGSVVLTLEAEGGAAAPAPAPAAAPAASAAAPAPAAAPSTAAINAVSRFRAGTPLNPDKRYINGGGSTDPPPLFSPKKGVASDVAPILVSPALSGHRPRRG